MWGCVVGTMMCDGTMMVRCTMIVMDDVMDDVMYDVVQCRVYGKAFQWSSATGGGYLEEKGDEKEEGAEKKTGDCKIGRVRWAVGGRGGSVPTRVAE